MKTRVETKPIKHGQRILDPFRIDQWGRVYGAKDKRLNALSREKAAKVWQRQRAPLRNMDGSPLPRFKPDDLLDVELQIRVPATDPSNNPPVPIPGVCWELEPLEPGNEADVYTLEDFKAGRKPAVRMANFGPSIFRLCGDRDEGWYFLEVARKFRTVLHGPSVAALLFPQSETICTE